MQVQSRGYKVIVLSAFQFPLSNMNIDVDITYMIQAW